MSSLRALAVAQDKAFKYEALHHDTSQAPITLPQLTAPPRQSFYKLKRAELVARKARVDALMALRARGEKEAHLRWPRFRQSREEQQKRQRAADGKHRADEEACRSAGGFRAKGGTRGGGRACRDVDATSRSWDP
ncbi:hypothetical protein DFH09DRAFT_1308391 [Mycena vulgaris]|nr:hypothetical protein DFH09DRAFT_1308391 [Mycena vulgaris]